MSMKERKKYECTWDLGDTYAVKLTNDVAKELGMFGMYAVLQKIDSVDFGDGRILPLVYITVWDDLPNPMTEDIFTAKGQLSFDQCLIINLNFSIVHKFS